MLRKELHDSDAPGSGSTALLPGPRWLRVPTNTLPFCSLPPPAPAETMSLLVTAARCHSPEPSMTQKGLSEKTLLLLWSRMGREGSRGGNRGAHCLSPSRRPTPLLLPPPGPPSSPSEGSTAK